MSKQFFLGVLFLFTSTSFAIVDMKSANYSESWTDLIVPGIGFDLRVNRTYNSRSLFSGLFGFGWCSDFETKIEVTTESNLRLTECGSGMEITYTPRNFDPKAIDSTVAQIIAEVKKRRPDLKGDYITDLEKEMRVNDFMREEFGRRMNIKGKPSDGTLYLANGRESETLVLKQGTFKRTLQDGTYQIFDATTGRLTYMYDRNQNHLKLAWDKDALQSVSDNMGRKLSFKYDPLSKKVAQIVGPNGLTAQYVVKGEDLVEVVDSKNQRYKYTYDDVHNLLRMDLPDNTYKAVTYNKDKDWVTGFRNRKGCQETYDYQVSKDDPKNHFWSNVVKKCGEKVTNRSKYEFFHKTRADGGIFLQRVRTEINGSVTDIVYHDVLGKPLSIVKDNEKTEYTYYDNGLVKSKKEPDRISNFEYKNSCNKVSQLVVQFTPNTERRPSQAKTEKGKTVKTSFTYDSPKCNLILADTSDGQRLKLKYDPQGRISQIEDQTQKVVQIKYETKFGKPSVVTRPGLGAITVSYKPDGEILKVESREGQTVAVQVASIFNGLLDVIAPATSEAPL